MLRVLMWQSILVHYTARLFSEQGPYIDAVSACVNILCLCKPVGFADPVCTASLINGLPNGLLYAVIPFQ